jgi:hypothetical protein
MGEKRVKNADEEMRLPLALALRRGDACDVAPTLILPSLQLSSAVHCTRALKMQTRFSLARA